MKIKKVSIESVSEDPTNARSHSAVNIEAIENSLKEFGQVEPLVVHKSSHHVIGGNARLSIMKRLGWKQIDIVEVDLPPDKTKALGIALNRTGELAEWNKDNLKTILDDLKLKDFDISKLGFKAGDLESLFGTKEIDGKTDPDAVPEVKKATAKAGQLWKLGNHRLMCGDATNEDDVKRLLNGQDFDMIFTDPPYGLGGYGGRNNMPLKGDDQDITPFYSAIPDAKEIYVWGRVYNLVDINFKPRDIIVWRKNNFGLGVGYRGQYEVCFYKGDFKGSDSDVWDINKDVKYKHPTQKPVDLCIRAIRNSDPKTVFDLFLGSGSTMIACEKTDRRCYGLEIDPHYCDVIIKRWEDFTGKKSKLMT